MENRMDFKTQLLSGAGCKKVLMEQLLMELGSDERMAGHRHFGTKFGFKLSTEAKGERVFKFGDDADGSVSFELAQLAVGPGICQWSDIHRPLQR
jgi:hypothetical protein